MNYNWIQTNKKSLLTHNTSFIILRSNIPYYIILHDFFIHKFCYECAFSICSDSSSVVDFFASLLAYPNPVFVSNIEL